MPVPIIWQVSKMSLVDLAGSERVESSGATGDRLKVKPMFVLSFLDIFYARRKVLTLTSHSLH